MTTVRLTVAQALVRFLACQYSERDGVRQRFFAGCFGIFGHGNVAGVGQALLQAHETGEADLRYLLARNEQAMVHASVGFARMRNRLQAFACTASIGPGSTNMVTGAALATINRVPVLLLPSDVFATRVASPVLQELEDPRSYDVSVNDAFRPVSRFFDRIWRPEQLPSALLAAMRVLTDPAETGAVTLALPQDVQAEAHDWPEELFAERTWHVPRPVPEPAALARAASVLRSARRPLIIAGGGVIYSEASAALRALAEATGIPVADTQAGKGALAWDHPCAGRRRRRHRVAGGQRAGPRRRRGDRRRHPVQRLHHRLPHRVPGPRAEVRQPQRRELRRGQARGSRPRRRRAGRAGSADRRAGRLPRRRRLRHGGAERNARWRRAVDHAYHLGHEPLPAQTEILGALNEFMADTDVVVQAAGSMPGDLQMLWRARDPKQYHVEYGYSCMGYEIAGALGVKLADPAREVFALVGDGSYLMMAQEIVTAVAERIKLTVVLVDNHGFSSIGALSESLGSQRFGTSYRYRNPESGLLDGDYLPVDLAANAASLGADVIAATTIPELREALARARASDRTTVVYIETDPLAPVPSSESWWDVPVSEVSALASTQKARAAYEAAKASQRLYL